MAFTHKELPRDELLQAQALIWNHIFSFIKSFSLKCAIQLEIPDIIHMHGKPMTLSDLVEALPINKAKAGCVHRLMRLLTHSGFFLIIPDDGGYALTPAATLLLKDNPLSVTPFLQGMLDPSLTECWHKFSNWFKDGLTSPFETFHGKPFWEVASDEPELNNFFNESMASDARLLSGLVIRDFRHVFEGVDSVVDVGGGTGTMAKAIADEFPHLSFVVLDLPHVVDGLKGTNNLVFVGGDMFESVPPADEVLLKVERGLRKTGLSFSMILAFQTTR